MRVYFLSEIPCSLKIDGAYLGLCDHFERFAELDLNSTFFLEFLPFENFLPIRFRLDSSSLLSPPEHISLYYFKEGIAIYAFGYESPIEKTIEEKTFARDKFTLLRKGRLFLKREGKEALPLPDFLETGSWREEAAGYLLFSEEGFCFLPFEGEPVVQEGKILSCEKTLIADIPFRDSRQHIFTCEWQNGKLISCKLKTASPPTEATFALAFFESVLLGADSSLFLSEELKGKEDRLKDYLKDFRSVVLTEQNDRVGLVYERQERVFFVRYFSVELENGKIKNIIPDED